MALCTMNRFFSRTKDTCQHQGDTEADGDAEGVFGGAAAVKAESGGIGGYSGIHGVIQA